MGRNDGFLVTADDALLAAHPGGESARRMLATALALALPADGQEPKLGSARNLLGELCGRLRTGLQMPNTAQRLVNTFENDCRIEDTLALAADMARDSLALKAERARAAFVREALGGD